MMKEDYYTTAQALLSDTSAMVNILRHQINDEQQSALADTVADMIIDARRLLMEGDAADGRRALSSAWLSAAWLFSLSTCARDTNTTYWFAWVQRCHQRPRTGQKMVGRTS